MSHDLATEEPGTDIAVAAAPMGQRRIRQLPVVDRGELIGMCPSAT
jgi:CBS domain-containing protein